METGYRAHLVKDFGERTVLDFDTNHRKVNPVKDLNALIELFDGL